MSTQEAWRYRLWTTEQATEIDRLCIESCGLPGIVLMDHAGLAVAMQVRTSLPLNSSVLILVGPGNNGGDGLVAARYLHEWGIEVRCILVSQNTPPKLTNSTAAQLTLIKNLNIPVVNYSYGIINTMDLENVCVVDAALGIGVKGSLRKGPVLDCLTEVAAAKPRWTIAVDLPSGMNADALTSGQAPLSANETVTFGQAKPAHIAAPMRTQCGKLHVEEIGFLKQAIEEGLKQGAKVYRVDKPSVLKANPWDKLGRDAHKYDRGHVLVIGGSIGKWGAPTLSAMAANRSGAGWVTLALPSEDDAKTICATHPQLTYESLWNAGKVDGKAVASFSKQRNVRGIVIGPGAMTTPLDTSALQSLHGLQKELGTCIVFDAGACHQLLQMIEDANVAFQADRTVATPHPGEWKKLCNSPPTIKDVAAARDLQNKLATWGVSFLYKSATPILCRETDLTICDLGNVSLAKAGTGDVLAGCIAAHGAVGCDTTLATMRSLATVSAASDIASLRFGTHGLGAEDILDALSLC